MRNVMGFVIKKNTKPYVCTFRKEFMCITHFPTLDSDFNSEPLADTSFLLFQGTLRS